MRVPPLRVACPGSLRWLLPGLLAMLLLMRAMAEAAAAPMAETIPVRVGILAFRPKAETVARWHPLIEYLERRIPERTFQLRVYHLDELERAVARGEIDFILTQPSHYVQLTYQNGLSSPLASLVNKEGKFGVSVFGGVIVSRANRDDIAHLSDLRDKLIAVPARNSLGAYQMQAFELLQVGIELPGDARLLETGQPQDKAIEAVLAGRADAAFARTGLIESMIAQGRLDPSKIKLLGAQWQPDFPFLVSTRLYPEWPFAAMPHVPADLARRVAAALLSMQHEGAEAQRLRIVGFSIPGDYRSIDELLRQLRLPPFDRAPAFTLADVLQRFQPQILLASLFVLLMLTLGLLTLVLLNRRLRQERNRVASNEARQRALFQALGEGVLGSDLDARCTFVNPQALAMLGYSEAECLGQDMYRLLHGERANPAAAERIPGETLQSALLGHQAFSGEAIFHRSDGSAFPAAFVVTPLRENEQISGSVLAFSDIGARKAAEARIQHLAYHDELTGLPNRSLLIERLGRRSRLPRGGNMR